MPGAPDAFRADKVCVCVCVCVCACFRVRELILPHTRDFNRLMRTACQFEKKWVNPDEAENKDLVLHGPASGGKGFQGQELARLYSG